MRAVAGNTWGSRLDVIQHKALRIACGAFCSRPVSALEVETGEMPLALRRSQLEIKHAVKVKATESHPAKSVTEFHWTLSKKFKPNNLPIYIYSKTQEYFSGSPAENVQAPVLPEKAPWHSCSVDSSLINFGSKQENPAGLNLRKT